MYKGLAGIFPDPAQPGFRHTLLRPNFVKGLDQFSATHESPYGVISSSWKKEGKVIVYKVILPPNTTATLQLPGQAPQEVSAGEHIYKIN